MSENNEAQEIFPVRMSTKGVTFDKDFTGGSRSPESSPKDSSAPVPAIDSEQPPKQTDNQGLPGPESVTPQAPEESKQPDPPEEKKDETKTTSTSVPSPTSPQPPKAPSVSAAKASKSKNAEAS